MVAEQNGNWGFIFDSVSQTSELAPIYDCGSCLLPQADEKIMQRVLEDENELNSRVYQFPTSAIKQNGRKISYYDFIDKVPCISDLQKEFYKTYISARYEKIIMPSYELVMKQNEQEKTSHDEMPLFMRSRCQLG